DRGAGRRPGTLVAVVGDTIAIGIPDLHERATIRVYLGARRRAGALVEAIQHPVRVRVGGTARRVDGGARRRARALIEPVVDAVVIGVGGAAAGVHGGADGRAGAGILAIHHAVFVRIGGLPPAVVEERQADRSDEVRHRARGEARLGTRGVDHPGLDAQGELLA